MLPALYENRHCIEYLGLYRIDDLDLKYFVGKNTIKIAIGFEISFAPNRKRTYCRTVCYSVQKW
jgi:hypothetical protein